MHLRVFASPNTSPLAIVPLGGNTKYAFTPVFDLIKEHSQPASPATNVGSVAFTTPAEVSMMNVRFISVAATLKSVVFELAVGLYQAFDALGKQARRTSLIRRK